MGKPTIIDEPYKIAAGIDDAGDNSYRGLRIHALPGLHEHVAEKIAEHVPRNARILDLACGSGAMCARLADMGYELTAADCVTENFRLHGHVAFEAVDLNSNFESAIEGKFDCVLAIEIIEHLENPRSFLRSVLRKCRKDAVVVITTPNIANPVSKAMFSRFGTFQWFSDDDYQREGHINPISPWLMEKILAEQDIHIIHKGSFGDPYYAVRNWWRMKWMARFIDLVSTEARAHKNEVLVVIGKAK